MRFAAFFLFAAGLFGADVQSEGLKVHYESYGQGREAVVFIHGWTCDLTFWRGQAPLYKKQRALLIDLPGHGESGKPEVAYTQERFARAIDAVMRDAKVDRAVLVGHSMGGTVAFTFVRMFPAKAKGLVLVDAYVPKTPKDEAERAANAARMQPMVASFRSPGYRKMAAGMVEGMFSARTTPALREEIKGKMATAPQHVMASALEGMFAAEAPKPGETFPLPVLVIVAAGPSRVGDEAVLRTAFPSLRKYEAWEGAGHFLMMESAERFNASLGEFLAGLR